MSYEPDVLAHYCVKGMKWGVRRYQNKDGSLTEKRIKRYAKKGYAQDSYNSNKTALGKAYDLYTGAHKIDANLKYKAASTDENLKRAKEYLRKRGGIMEKKLSKIEKYESKKQ